MEIEDSHCQEGIAQVRAIPPEISLWGDEKSRSFSEKRWGFPAFLCPMEDFLICKERNSSAQTAWQGAVGLELNNLKGPFWLKTFCDFVIPCLLPAHHDIAWKTCKGRFSCRKCSYFSESKCQCSQIKSCPNFFSPSVLFWKGWDVAEGILLFLRIAAVLLRCKSK